MYFSTNKTDRHDTTERLLKVPLNTIKQRTSLAIILSVLPFVAYDYPFDIFKLLTSIRPIFCMNCRLNLFVIAVFWFFFFNVDGKGGGCIGGLVTTSDFWPYPGIWDWYHRSVGYNCPCSPPVKQSLQVQIIITCTVYFTLLFWFQVTGLSLVGTVVVVIVW